MQGRDFSVWVKANLMVQIRMFKKPSAGWTFWYGGATTHDIGAADHNLLPEQPLIQTRNRHMLTLHAESHRDHGITDAQMAHILERYADRTAFFIDTFELPDELGTVPCGLYGPLMGDVSMADRSRLSLRGNRTYPSRTVSLPPRPSRMVTVIAGPHEEHKPTGCMKYDCILYTAFGGPLTPKEPGDTAAAIVAYVHKALTDGGEEDRGWWQLAKLHEEHEKSVAFWADHALSTLPD
jgi:hypothetical protein